MGYIKLKHFYIAKETINKTKRQPTRCKKIFAVDTSDKRLISKICQELIQFNIPKQFGQWAKDLKGHLSRRDIQMANRHMERCSILLIIRETQMKTTTGYHLIPVKMAIINKSTNKYCQRRGERGMFVPCWWDYKWAQPP